MKIKLEQVIEAIETADDAFTYFYDTQTGETLPPGAVCQELAHAIRGKGAFRRLKNGIYYHHIERQWYDYQAAAYREIAIRWCRDEEIEYIETE
ncbi:UPF0158 family protein [uncultured Oscillibacter sp.]|uniref:UPF0158 family protein n=1 Tax=uncultured Oscillibacter sp. TaxID=876091 RepID=UPI0025E34B54|nr:UPF0158 family protein [uncultured Oscillibacter sp.]